MTQGKRSMTRDEAFEKANQQAELYGTGFAVRVGSNWTAPETSDVFVFTRKSSNSRSVADSVDSRTGRNVADSAESGSMTGRDYFRACIGNEHYPVAGLGQHSGRHPINVRAVYLYALKQFPEAADVIAALVFQIQIDQNLQHRHENSKWLPIERATRVTRLLRQLFGDL